MEWDSQIPEAVEAGMHVGCAWSAVAGFLGPLTGCALFKAKSWTSSRTSTVFRQTVADPPIV